MSKKIANVIGILVVIATCAGLRWQHEQMLRLEARATEAERQLEMFRHAGIRVLYSSSAATTATDLTEIPCMVVHQQSATPDSPNISNVDGNVTITTGKP